MIEDSVTTTTGCKRSVVDILCRILYNNNKNLHLDRVEDLSTTYFILVELMIEDSVTTTKSCKRSVVDILCRILYNNKNLHLDRVED